MAPARDVLISKITPAELEGRTFGYLWTGIGLVTAVSLIVVGYIASVAGLRLAFDLLAIALALSAVPVAALFSDRLYVSLDHWRQNQSSD